LQNFTQKDLTEVKILQKVLGATSLKTICNSNEGLRSIDGVKLCDVLQMGADDVDKSEHGFGRPGDSQLVVLCRRRSDRLVPVQSDTADADDRRQQQVRNHRRASALDASRRSRRHPLY